MTEWANSWDAVEDLKREWRDRLISSFGVYQGERPTVIAFVDNVPAMMRCPLGVYRPRYNVEGNTEYVDLIVAPGRHAGKPYNVKRKYTDIPSPREWVLLHERPPPDDFIGGLR